ncbi:short-chain dehydrogenase/reductase [Gordonia sp. L191]|uniref:short-chain dehydrogenase/reductase n=1 Tax=Gordonia sp. L191 TaxID=2982699 RepID=UPI0024BFE210|nr:short-chain dehydrogenase/reductase [Gordonia sp. L191]WHU47811.1 short-chain dehydrogenase/reductase [Gordonia sp. L191]
MSRRSGIHLPGAVALVTGGAQGIGLATTRRLVGRGARVVVTDIDTGALAAADAELGSDNVVTVDADVRDLDALRAAVRHGIDRFGHLDVAIANAGVTPPPATLRDIDPEAFRRVLDINLIGAFNTIKATVEPIIAGRGHIELVASCAAFAPGMGGSAYMISKSAVEQLGRALRIEVAPHGASAGLAYFGIVDTKMTRETLDDDPLGREIGAQLPWPLSTRITGDRAAEVIVDAVADRRARAIAPRSWVPYSLLRGLINPVLDAQLVRDKSIHAIIDQLEAQARR